MMTIILNCLFFLLFQTYGRLEKQGVCLSHTSMINLLDLMGGHFHDKIVELVKAGKKFYTVNDNLNCKTTVKNMRVDHRNKQHNWFASIVSFGRIEFSHLDNVGPDLVTVRIFLMRVTSLPQRKSRNFSQISKFLWGESF